MAYKEIQNQAWKPEKSGDFIEGTLQEKVKGRYGKDDYILKKGKEQVTVFGNTVLESKMRGVKVGDKLKITFMGVKQNESGDQDYKDFKIEVDDE